MGSEALRPELGNFSSIVCFKAAIEGMEEALGEKTTAISLIAAGRSRGKKLAQSFGLVGANISLDEVARKLNDILGKEGTRLCIVNKIVTEGDVTRVYTSDTLCSAGEPQGAPRKCTYTLGAVWGALEQVFGKRLQGAHTESVLRGGSYDVFEFKPLG